MEFESCGWGRMAGFNYKGIKYSRKVSSMFCQEHRYGDKVSLIYLEPYPQILFPTENLYIDLVSLSIIALSGLISLVYGLFSQETY